MKVRLGVGAIALMLLSSACGGTVSKDSGGSNAPTSTGSKDTSVVGATTAAGTSAATTAGSTATTGGTVVAGKPATGKPIRIGIAVAQTGGSAAALGQDQVIGVNAAVKYFNAHGGVNGRPIELALQDTLVDEAGAINAFNTLLADDTIVGIIGPTLSQQALAADPIADQARMPVVAPSNTAKGIPDIDRAVVAFAQNDAFAKNETEVFQKAVTDAGIEVVQPVLTFQTTDTDFTTQVNAILDADPKLVVVSGLATDGGNLVRQLRETGYKGTIVAGNGMNTRNIFKVCQASCDGLIIAQAYSYSFDSPLNRAFTEQYKTDKGELPLQLAAQAFTAVQVFVEALAAVDTKTPLADMDIAATRTAVNTAILAGKYDTVLGPLSFEPNGEVVQDKFYVAQVKMTSASEGDFTYLS
jgi:branched-chain amino acid transport system substrate-binding protein